MGSNYVFNRKLKLPIIGQLSLDMVVRGYEPDEVDSFLTKADVYELVVSHPVAQDLGDQGSFYISNGYYYLAMEKNEWSRIAFVEFTHSVFGNGDTDFSPDGNFYYVCIDGFQWGMIPLTSSNMVSSKGVVYSYTFIHVNNNGTWMNFLCQNYHLRL